jgi:hypothetical protein
MTTPEDSGEWTRRSRDKDAGTEQQVGAATLLRSC